MFAHQMNFPAIILILMFRFDVERHKRFKINDKLLKYNKIISQFRFGTTFLAMHGAV